MYTCCTEIFPNTFTSSGYYEPVWLAWNVAERGFDGYLRWSFDNWHDNPLNDNRFRKFPTGDTWLIYPENQTSIRLEKLREGIQDFEKIRLTQERLSREHKIAERQLLEQQIKNFSNKKLDRSQIPKVVREAKRVLNSL